MAPIRLLKRRSEQGSEDSEDDSATGLARQAAAKRQRLSGAASRSRVDSQDALSIASHETSEADAYPLNGGAFVYEDYRDAASEHDPEEEAALIAEHNALREQRQRERQSLDLKNQNRPIADNAIIEQIDCTNFMCHTRLTLNLGPLINFIIGHNGSGKSAALTALQLCLGSKVAATNRGGRLADFIKHGSEWASLSVKIKNQGPSAYLPELYGPSIVVERHFTRSGTSGFKLKNSQGKIISTKKTDLDAITDSFCLQLGNPMMCLTQDQARQFINDSNPSQKYMFFFKGTQLETLDRDYKMLSDTLNAIEVAVDWLKEDKLAAERAHKEAEKRVKEAEELVGLNDKYRKYSRQMVWVQVRDQEKLLEDQELRCTEGAAKLAQRQEAAEQCGQEYDAADAAHEDAKLALEALEHRKNEPAEERQPVSDEFDKNKKDLETIIAEERSIREQLKNAKNRGKTTEQKIEEERQRLAERDGGQHAQLIEDLVAARNEVAALETEYQDHNTGYGELERNKVEAERAVAPYKEQVSKIRADIDKSRQRIDVLESGRGQWMNAYRCGPDKMRNLLKAIDNETRFREKPVGPVGQYIQLLKPQWSSILETSFGGSLGAFVCTSKADQTILNEQMRRLNIQLPTFIGDKNPINTSGNEPDPELLTWARALKFDNDLVRNTCIIHNGIDQTVLIENDREARAFMFDRAGRPRNVRATYSMHDTAAGCGWRLTVGASGAESRTNVQKWPHSARMKTDADFQIRLERDNLQQLNRDVKDAEHEQRQAEIAAKEANQAIVRHKRATEQSKRRLADAKLQVEEIDDKIQAAQPQENALDAYEEQLQSIRAEMSALEGRFQDAYSAKTSLNDVQRELFGKLQEFDKQIEQFEVEHRKLQSTIKRKATKREDALYKKNEAFERVKDAELDRNAAEEKRDVQRDSVRVFTQHAEEVHARVPLDHGQTLAKVEALLARTMHQINTQQNRLGGDREDLLRKQLAAKELYQREERRLEAIMHLIKILQRARMMRIDKWKELRSQISIAAKTQFTYLLTNRSYRGEVMFDHKTKLLDIRIEPDATRKSAAGRQTKTLSGGEKSFSTICLLLALWEAMGSPIRCLDEFDVFMDQVNRAVTVEMIIDGARDSGSRQFILISPQSMKQDIVKTDVTIIKMRDPERGQQALPEYERVQAAS